MIGNIVHFACHPTCCGSLLQTSSDFCGEARRRTELHTKALTIFLQGACGDINPLERKGGYAAAARMGAALAAAVIAVLRRTQKEKQ